MRRDPSLRKAQDYFNEHLSEFQERFPGEYIAILPSTCEVLYHHKELGEVTSHAYSNYEERPIFIHQVPVPRPLMTYEEFREISRRKQGE